jgi:D-glucuronyl C5-epimerase C-terminus
VGLASALLIALVLASTASASPVMTLRSDGSVFKHNDPYLPPAQSLGPAPTATGAAPATRMGATARAGKRKTVKGELKRMLKAGAISRAQHDAYRSIYFRAQQTRSKLSGTRRSALNATIKNLEGIAASGQLTVSRLPALFETVKRNRSWWSTGPLLGGGQRVTFAGSRLVWQYYAGQGLQIQWLGTFGKANALWTTTSQLGNLRKLLDEAIALGAQRAGGLAFEYLFHFGGGSPPWVSGLAQGTAIQALTRSGVKLAEPRYIAAARSALGIFRTGPPTGVRVKTAAGAHYLIYSYAGGYKVLNAFTQSLNGLYDYASLTGDPEGRALFAQGEAQLRKELPFYTIGNWSRYSLSGEIADLSYHTLARDFLRGLCTRLKAESPQPGIPTTGGTTPTSPTVPVLPGADATPYCAAADRFTSDLKNDPKPKLLSRSVRAGKPASVRLRIDKPAYVKLAIYRDGKVIVVMTAHLSVGNRSLRWIKPRFRGTYDVKLRATDLAGNVGNATGELQVLKKKG